MTKEEIVRSVAEGRSYDGAVIKGVDLTGTRLRGGRFPRANFRYSILSKADLTEADLREANLRHVLLNGANLSRADLRGADLSHANLRGANLTDAKLDGAILKGAQGISQNVFFTQEILDTLNAENKISLEEDVLVVFTRNNPRYRIVSAVRFVKLEDGKDNANLLGKVKTEEEFARLGVEVYNNSALHEETVYTVENGFLGLPIHEDHAPAPEASAEAPPPTAVREEEPLPDSPATDEDLLASFLLKNLK